MTEASGPNAFRRAEISSAGIIFTLISALPVPLILLAVWFGGAWGWIALVYLTLFAFAMDELVHIADDGRGGEFPAADVLSVGLAFSHFVVLGAVLWRFGQDPTTAEAIALYMSAGLFMGQIGNANAHELIHRGNKAMRRLGTWVYISLLFGHHASAHPLVHHRHVASPLDPNTARRGEGYYRFLLRAWRGSFVAGYKAEAEKRRRGRHPYITYFFGGGLCLALAYALGGWLGLFAYVGLCLFAQSQLLMSDYVQHYGLQRQEIDGRLEPVGEAHSWNAPHLFTSHMMLNAPRHSAHHVKPAARYDALPLPKAGQVPMLPYSLPAMSMIALVPPLWRRVMARELRAWQDIRSATSAA